MAALITTTPNLVATAAQDRSNQNSNFIGARALLRVGSNLYAGLMNNASPGFQVWKSTNQGITWTRMNQAGEPATTSFPIGLVVTNQAGLFYVWNDSGFLTGQAIRFCKFDVTTDTWGAIVSSPDNITQGAFQTADIRSNNDVVVFYQIPASTDTHWGIFSHLGTWSAGDNLFYSTVTSASKPLSCITDSNDNLNVLIQDKIGPFLFFYKTLSSANVVGASVALTPTLSGAANALQAGTPTLWNNNIVFAVGQTNQVSPGFLWIGGPISSPTWQQVALPLTPTTSADWPVCYVTPDNRLFIFQSLQTPGHTTLQIWATQWNGTSFGTPILVYDAIANPPSTGAVDDLLNTGVATLTGGKFGIILPMQKTAGTPPEDTFFISGSFTPNNVRLQVYDDGAGEYLFAAPFNSLLVAGSENSGTGLPSGAIGPFILPSPLPVTKPGLVTVTITNVNQPLNTGFATPNTVTVYVGLVFAIPKRCRGQLPSIFQQQGRAGRLS